MNFFKRLDCAWRGHRDVCNDLQGWVCLDCGRQMSYDEAVKRPIRTKLRDWWQLKKDWWKCSECGGRFGKHDDKVSHIPF